MAGCTPLVARPHRSFCKQLAGELFPAPASLCRHLWLLGERRVPSARSAHFSNPRHPGACLHSQRRIATTPCSKPPSGWTLGFQGHGGQVDAQRKSAVQDRASGRPSADWGGWPGGRRFSRTAASTGESEAAAAPGGRGGGEAPPTLARVLAVAGSDSGGGAGIQADLKACAALGAYCMTAVTALTAQNTHGVQSVSPVPPAFVEEQMRSCLLDIGADVVKTGMLPNAEVVKAVAAVLRAHHRGAVVVDPVLVATSGDRLAESDVLAAMREHLLPACDLVTPNLVEAAALLGGGAAEPRDLPSMRAAAAAIREMGPRNVLIKGGHLAADATDVFFDGVEFRELSSTRVQTRNTHGTGCTLASSVAAYLARGYPMLSAVEAAKEYLTGVLEGSAGLRLGGGRQGPLNHFSGRPRPELQPHPGRDSPRAKFRPEDLMLYAVTDPRMNARWQRTLCDAVAAAIDGGATFLQIREKDADTGDFLREATAAVQLARARGVPLVVNDRVDVALAAGADGVHVGQSDMPAAAARRLLGPAALVGVSCKTVAHAAAARAGGADYIGVGGVFLTSTKENNLTIGLEGLREVCMASPLPVVAIGGISAGNVADVLELRAPRLSGVAVVSALFDQPDVAAATRQLRDAVAAALARVTPVSM